MTRHDPTTPDEREALKKEIKAEIRKEARNRKLVGYGSCVVMLLVAILVPAIYFASLLARTGLVEVPVLTNWLFEPMAPTRPVTRLVGSTGQDVIGSVAANAKYEPQLNLVSLQMTEQQLTTLVGEGIDQAARQGALPVDVDVPQIVITEDGLEFFARIPREKRSGTVLLRFGVEVNGGKLLLTTEEFLLGGVEVPSFIANVLLGTLSNTVTETVERGLGAIGNISTVDTEEGKLIIKIQKSP